MFFGDTLVCLMCVCVVCCVFEYLCEGPPVHVGTANENVLFVYNPELGVKDARGELSHINCPDISS